MALDATKLEKVAGGARAVYHYNTTDAIATVRGSGYFNSVTNNLKQFDVILVVSSTGGTVACTVLAVTSANFAATVTTSTV